MRWLLAMLALAALGAGCFGLAQIDWSHALSCSKGQHLYIVTWVPITVGKTIVITPIYGCES